MQHPYCKETPEGHIAWSAIQRARVMAARALSAAPTEMRSVWLVVGSDGAHEVWETEVGAVRAAEAYEAKLPQYAPHRVVRAYYPAPSAGGEKP